MAGRKTDDSANALHRLRSKQTRGEGAFEGRCGQQRGKVVGKGKSVGIGRIDGISGPGIARAQIAMGVVRRTGRLAALFLLTLPGTPGSMR